MRCDDGQTSVRPQPLYYLSCLNCNIIVQKLTSTETQDPIGSIRRVVLVTGLVAVLTGVDR